MGKEYFFKTEKHSTKDVIQYIQDEHHKKAMSGIALLGLCILIPWLIGMISIGGAFIWIFF